MASKSEKPEPDYCRSCDHTHLVGTPCWFANDQLAGGAQAPPPVTGHDIVDGVCGDPQYAHLADANARYLPLGGAQAPPPPPVEDVICEHGTAMDIHCCGCHSGYLFDVERCTCLHPSETMMTKKTYPCGCSAVGQGRVPDYCPDHSLRLYRCKICGTRWLLWPDAIHGGGWNLLDQWQRPGACCDNVAMGEQIEHLRDIPLAVAAPPPHPEAHADVSDDSVWISAASGCARVDVDILAAALLGALRAKKTTLPIHGHSTCAADPQVVLWRDIEEILKRAGAPHPAPQWQPIVTAPKEGEILVYDDGATFISWWSDDDGAWMDSAGAPGHQKVEPPPQFWLPLPAPPAPQEPTK